MSNFFIAVIKMLGIETVRTSAYYPQTNWQDERCNRTVATQSIVNNSGYLYRLFHSRAKSAFLGSHMYVSGRLLCCHEPKNLQDPVH